MRERHVARHAHVTAGTRLERSSGDSSLKSVMGGNAPGRKPELGSQPQPLSPNLCDTI